jgi:membrane protein YqaA with SNARE-associated domain
MTNPRADDCAGPVGRGWARVLDASRRAYLWLLGWADRPAGPAVLVVFALLEATVFPAPTEALLIALALGRPRRAWRLAALATVASVLGGLTGYQVGRTLFGEVARPLLTSYGLLKQLDTVANVYRDNALLALVTSGYTPIPYMLYTMAAGAFGIPLLPFVVGSLVGRALKYVPIGALVYFLGPAVRPVLDRYGPWVVAAVVAALVIGTAAMILT